MHQIVYCLCFCAAVADNTKSELSGGGSLWLFNPFSNMFIVVVQYNAMHY